MADLSTTNVWLAILALVSLAEFLVIGVLGVLGVRLYRRTSALIDRAEATYVAPVAAKVTMVADEARDVVQRVQRLEERACALVARAEHAAGRLDAVAQHAWPIVGAWRAVSAAVGSLKGGGRHGTLRT